MVKIGRPSKDGEQEEVKHLIPKPEEVVEETFLIKSSDWAVIGKLVEAEAVVEHISGKGNKFSPRYFFMTVTAKMLNLLTEKERRFIEDATKEEIENRIQKSFIEKEIMRDASMAQKSSVIKPRFVSEVDQI